MAPAAFPRLLPAGVDSERTWLMKILDASGRQVGLLWMGPHPDGPSDAYVHRMEIYESARGQGFGRAAMQGAEELARASGATAIGLNVLGDNAAARGLYYSLAYTAVSTQMIKTLSSGSP